MFGKMSDYSKLLYHLPVEIIDLNGKATEVEIDMIYYLSLGIYCGKRFDIRNDLCKKYEVSIDAFYRASRRYCKILHASLIHEFKIIYDSLTIVGIDEKYIDGKTVDVLVNRFHRYFYASDIKAIQVDLKIIYKLISRILDETFVGDEERLMIDKIFKNIPDVKNLIKDQMLINEAYRSLIQRTIDYNNKRDEKEKKKYEKEGKIGVGN